MPSYTWIKCPRCRSQKHILIDKFGDTKILRCLECRRKYTANLRTKKLIRKDMFAQERKWSFRAHCPKCGSYMWSKTIDPPAGGQKPRKRDYLCICGVTYTADFRAKKVKERR